MAYNRMNGAQIAPCIISKVRFDFGLSRSSNNKHPPCSRNYWNEAVQAVAAQHNITDNKKIEQVKSRFKFWF
jgi:hypothetical protein